MAKRLHQIVVIERGVEADTERVLEQHKRVFSLGGEQNPMKGISRTYRPVAIAEGEDDTDLRRTHPDQYQKVQVKASEMIPEIRRALTDLFNVKFTREYGNTQARADLVVDGNTLLSDVPATYFLFLEEQVKKIRAGLVSRLPVLDPSEDWHWDTARGIWATEPKVTESTGRTRHVQVLSKAQVIDGHKFDPQVQPYETDEKVGEWTVVKFSGQLPADEVRVMYDRCSRLIHAIKQAREHANSITAEEKDASPVLDYIFGG